MLLLLGAFLVLMLLGLPVALAMATSSLLFVIYGMMANVSIGALFLGGVIPGVVMTLMMMATVAYFAHRNGWGSDTPFSLRQVGSAGLEIVIVLSFPLAVWLMVVAGL